MVIDITADKRVLAINKKEGVISITAKAIVLAMGCRERTREAIKIPGDRPSGIFTAGTAQRYTNIEGFMPGKNVIILGSGDIGLIMARRMTLEGASVQAVLEILPYSSGLVRNKVQCLDDFGIPLKLNHTITRIEGQDRVERIRVAEVDQNLEPIPESEEWIECDTVLFSVGLIPENELTKGIGIDLDPFTGGPVVNEMRETEVDGVFAAGNVLHVHDLVDWVTEESEIAGTSIAEYLLDSRERRKRTLQLEPGENINYVIPNKVDFVDDDSNFTKLFMRVTKPMSDVEIHLLAGQESLLKYNKDFVLPGEMLTVNLPESIIREEMESLEISIRKQEGGGASEK
jgi:pyruvate/2-oxoglutarate dehydrogenase complex dihydrolipoamide dehydrogenase (E3) component